MKNLISTSKLSVFINRTQIIENISIDFVRGELVAVIGKNGAGKSTLLKAILQLLPHTGDCNLSSLTSEQRSRIVAWVPQQRDIIWNIPVKMLLHYTARKSAKNNDFETKSTDQTISEVLALTGTKHLLNHNIRSLSGGELTAVLIARALVQETPVLFMDEPLASLDPFQKLKILKLLKKLSLKGKTVVATLHDIDLIEKFFGRVISLKNGRVLDNDTPENVLKPNRLRRLYSD